MKSPVEAAVALAAVRLMANETLPGMLEWGEVGKHRGVGMVRIAMKVEMAHRFTGNRAANLFYAMTDGALIFALEQWVLEQRIDEQVDGTGPREKPTADPGAIQFAFELASESGRPMATAIAWALEGKLRSHADRSRGTAELLFRGAPELAKDPRAMRSLAFAYLGGTPVTPDGAAYAFAPEGPRDPACGAPYEPVWPDVPVAGSPVAKRLAAFVRVRTEVRFDDEGKDDTGKSMRSLLARATFTLAGPRP